MKKNDQPPMTNRDRIRHEIYAGRWPALSTFLPAAVALLLCITAPGGFAQQGPRNLYTVPNSTFYKQPIGESVITIDDTSGSLATLQVIINNTRITNPGQLIVINLLPGANYTVNSAPLQLESDMCLSGAGSTIAAASPAISAASLIRIAPGSAYVSVNDVTLDGTSANLRGIEAAGVSRVNIDKVRIFSTGQEGIFLQGLGNTVFDNELTVTRCTVDGASGSSGIRILDATQAICMENRTSGNLTGITIETSAYCTVINNRCTSNGATGLALLNADSCRVTHNLCTGNPTGISTDSASERSMLISNQIDDSTTGISLNGTGNTLYDNAFLAGTITPLQTAGSSHNVVANNMPLNAAGQNYFNPPTVDNDHSDSIMNSTARIDLTLNGTTLSAIQTQYDAARVSNPNAVLVLRLTAPQITGDATLVMDSKTCVLIEGAINLDPGVTAFSALNESFLSVSGGTINGGNTTGRYGMLFDNCSRLLIAHVVLQDFGDKNTRVSGSDVIAMFQGGTPCIVDGCTITGGAARGIWTKNATARFIITDNTVSDVNMDGIDIDAFTRGSITKFNTSFNNIRYGIFVEEGAKYNQVIGNTVSSNAIGINVYSYAAGPTTYNTIVGNECSYNGRGIRFGALSGQLTEHNFSFNNSVLNTTVADPQRGALDAQGKGSENYFSQHYLAGNPLDIGSTISAVFFNSPSTEGNSPPTISSIADQAVMENTATDPIPFTVNDEETSGSSLIVSGSSSDIILVPNSGIAFAGTGTNRTVTVTPAADQTGTVTITVTVDDGTDSSSETFHLDVIPDTPINTWKYVHFGTNWNNELIAGELADPDHDELVNLTEYGLAGDPNDDTTPDAPQGFISSNRLTMAFTRNEASTDISFTVAGADDLDGPWTDLASAANGADFTALAGGVGILEIDEGATRSVEIRDICPVTDPGCTNRFMRLTIQYPSETSETSDFSDDFESYILGNEVGSPWTVTDTDFQDGPSPNGQSLDITANPSPFSGGSRAVTYLDNNTDRSNPDLSYAMPTSWTGPLNIQFDYQVAANSGQAITFYLRGEDNDPDLHLRLRAGGGIRNKTDAGEELIRGISQGLWYHVDITTSPINPAGLETYDISVTRFSDGSTTAVTGLSFRRDVDTAYSSVLFQDVSGATQTSEWTIDNFSITRLPAP
jgi:parallel beta-helix repeat protein